MNPLSHNCCNGLGVKLIHLDNSNIENDNEEMSMYDN